MYFLLSPAKSLNEKDALPVNLGNYYSQPELIEHSQTLMKNLKAKEPIDLQGKLYTTLKTYDSLPPITQIQSYCDTADTGADYLCNIIYGIYGKEV